ncbi:MAG: hypothetical protein JWM10_379 [Myxococcaceae bacterium]|nr:hypothetical protein [Myxococcaceae bacterium]
MKTFTQPLLLIGSLALLAGCASDTLSVQGTAVLTTGGATPTSVRFDFAARPIALESGTGFSGSCARVANSWEVQIVNENPGTGDYAFRRLTLSIPVPTGLTRERPTANFYVGDSIFTASGTCVDTTTTVTDGLHVVTRCTGARATGDSRVFEADVNLVLTNCSLD